MSNYMSRLPLMRRPTQVADAGAMVDLRMEDGLWRQGFRALSQRVALVLTRSQVGEIRTCSVDFSMSPPNMPYAMWVNITETRCQNAVYRTTICQALWKPWRARRRWISRESFH
jgi:hypothetical protein